MKKVLFVLICVASTLFGAETIPARFISLSVQIFPARTEDGLGFGWSLGLSSSGNEFSLNDELTSATANHGFSHEGFFVFENDFEAEPFPIPFVLDLPPLADVNENGIEDFYDSAVPVNGISTQGSHPDANNRSVAFTATWTRAAGDSAGTVVLDFPYFGVTFQSSFQLLSYSGEFTFQATNNLREGFLNVTNVLDPQDIVTGPLSARVLNTNTISLSAVTWTNSAAATLTITTNVDGEATGTNFISFWLLEDGYPPTGEIDYQDWVMVLSSGDANDNGILDLVEGTVTSGERPRLELIRLPSGGLEITITGTPGQTYVLENANAIDSAAWQTTQNVTLVGATQKVTVPGAGTRRFYRVRQ